MWRIVLLQICFSLLVLGEVFSQSISRPAEWAISVSSESLKNLYLVNQDVYRSEQPNRESFIALEKMGIQTVLNLRTSFADKKLIKGLNFRYYQVPMSAHSISINQLIGALRVVKKAPKPVLVHCVHGADRTGAVIAMYRVVFESWSKEDAIDEMINGGFRFHDCYPNIPILIMEADIDSIRKQLNAE